MRLFSVINSHYSNDEFKKDLGKINQICNEKNTDDLSLSEVNRLISLHERSAISYRRMLEENEYDDNYDYFSKRTLQKEDSYLQNLPILISDINVGNELCLHIFTPYTFKRGMKDSFNLAHYLNAAIEKNIDDLKFFKNFKAEKMMVYVIRCGKNYNRKRYVDNDNMELSEMINIIFSHLCLSDCAKNMSIMSDLVLCDFENLYGLHLFILPYRLPLLHCENLLKYVKNQR